MSLWRWMFSPCLLRTHERPFVPERDDDGILHHVCPRCRQRFPLLASEMKTDGPRQIQAPIAGQPTGKAQIDPHWWKKRA